MALTNADIARTFERVAELLELQHGNPFRVNAWRHGAAVIRDFPTAAAREVQRYGREALKDAGLGAALRSVLVELVETGKLRMLQRLEAELPPVERLAALPGLGSTLARRAVQKLHLESLEDLEVAAHDGSLLKVRGFGPQRVELIQQQLEGLLGRRRRGERTPRPGTRHPSRPSTPPVRTLLDVDAEYRHKSRAGELTKIAPRRFNPDHAAWLPVLHTRRGKLEFTALFSNTARAHQLGTSHDWVVLYWGDDGRENQCTVVTETHGPLKGFRVVRGHEAECRDFYAHHVAAARGQPAAAHA